MIGLFLNTIKTKASLVGLLLIMVVSGNSQQIGFKEPLRESVQTQSILQDGDYFYAVGQWMDYTLNSDGVNLLKLDSLGQVVKEYRLSDTLGTLYPSAHVCLERLHNGDFICALTRLATPDYTALLRFNKNLDTVALYVPVSDGKTRVFQQVKQLPDSGFVITGYFYDQPKNMYHADLIRTDKNGNLLWEKIYKEPDSTSLDPYHVYLAPNGGFLIAGHRVYLADYQTADPLLLRVDSMGNELWRQSYGGSQVDGLACAVYRDDGNIMLHYTQGTHPIQQGHSFALVMAVVDDQNGQELKKKLYPFIDGRFNYSHNLIKDRNKFIGVGQYSPPDGDSTGKRHGYTLAIDKDFNDLWFKNYYGQISPTRYDDKTVLYDLRTTSDGGYISGGYFKTYDTTQLDVHLGYNGWIVKMDSMGCVEQSTCINRIGIEKVEPARELGIKIYPNPSSGLIHIELATVENGTATLYDLKGVKLQETQLVKGVGILNPHTNIATGIYVIQVIDKAGNHSSEKVIIQK